jgi:hypothetical protein
VPIASAATVLQHRYGAVSHLARQRGVCRQTLYSEAHTVVAAVQGTQAQDRLAQTQQRLSQVQSCLDQLQQQRGHAVVIDADRQAEFASTAQALGVSLTAAHALLAVFLGTQTPAVATLGRLAQSAGRRAAALLRVLDPVSRARARQVAADEIFSGRRPVLMTIEQDSLCWLGGRRADSRDGPQWAAEFRSLPAAQQVTCDGGQGLHKGLQLVNAERLKADQPPIADQDDHFHILHRGRRALGEVRHKAVRALRKAELAQKALLRQQRQGKNMAGRGRAVQHGWAKAEPAWDRWSAHERAWEQLQAALRLFTPTGELNTRRHAEGDLEGSAAEVHLSGRWVE